MKFHTICLKLKSDTLLDSLWVLTSNGSYLHIAQLSCLESYFFDFQGGLCPMASGDPPAGWTLTWRLGTLFPSFAGPVDCVWCNAGEPPESRTGQMGPMFADLRTCPQSHLHRHVEKAGPRYAVESVKVIEAETNSILHRPFLATFFVMLSRQQIRAVFFCNSCTLMMRFDSTNDDGLLSIRGVRDTFSVSTRSLERCTETDFGLHILTHANQLYLLPLGGTNKLNR